MSLEQRRRDALADLRSLLSEGVEPSEAVSDVATSYDFKPEAVRIFGQALLDNVEPLKRAASNSREKAQRLVQQNNLVRSYKALLRQDNKADVGSFLKGQPAYASLSDDEQSDVFLLGLDAWLEANVKDFGLA